MSESNPLAGLTEREADQAISRFQAKVDANDESLKAQKAHLKAMKAARKTLNEPVPVDAQGNGTKADADPAELAVEGGQP
jgi:hypothetical protein